MKKLLTLFIAAACLLGLTACRAKTLEAPPELRLIWTGGEATALQGGYDWSSKSGKLPNIIACGAHPLQCKDLLGEPLKTEFVTLDFAVKPDRIASVRCWSDQHWDDPEIPAEEATLDGYDLYAKEGGWIYALTAVWEDHGNCEYIFYLTFTPPVPSEATDDGGETALETPPELRIVASDGTVTASQGTYSWQYRLSDDLMQAIESDSAHPLQFKSLQTLSTGDAAVKLEFDVPPDSIAVRECWSDEYLGGDTDAPSEAFTLNGGEVTLKPGGYIYTVTARWDRETYSGSCIYVFHVVCSE